MSWGWSEADQVRDLCVCFYTRKHLRCVLYKYFKYNSVVSCLPLSLPFLEPPPLTRTLPTM